MSFGGVVRLVAEIQGRSEVYYDVGRLPNLALEGHVLPVGHPVREALIGQEVDRHRNPVTYFDTAELEADHPLDAPAIRFFVAVLADLSLTPEETQALWDVTGRGGEHLAALTAHGGNYIDLRPNDVVFLVDDTVADAPVVAVAHAIDAEQAGASAQLPRPDASFTLAIEAVVASAEGLFRVDRETDEPSPLPLGAGPVDRALGEEVLDLWHAHLIEVGWWGDLQETFALMDRYAAHFGSSEEPAAALAVDEGARADSEDASSLSQAPRAAPKS